MSKWQRLLVLIVITLLTMSVAIACNGDTGGGNGNGKIKVGSKNFPEQLILGEMYALVLKNQGLPVERKLNLGGTSVAQAAIENGEIDIYPEYTGTGLLTVLKEPAQSNPQKVYKVVARGYKEKFNLVWLKPAPMNSTQALVMTQEGSKNYQITTISQMVNQANNLIMVGNSEFEIRENGLPRLKQNYGDFQLKKYLSVDTQSRSKILGNGKADVAVTFGTDGEISAFNLVVLQDDKKVFPPYQVAPVVRQETLTKYPEIADVLNALASKLTSETMQKLNYQVTGERKDPANVAKAFLTQEGILK